MKKLFYLICMFFMLCSVAWADNVNQRNFEKKVIIELVNSNRAFSSLSKQQIFEDELNVFNNGGNCGIRELLKKKKEYETSNETKNINYEYICKMLNNYQAAFYTRKVDLLKPIYVDNTEYDLLSTDIKYFLFMYNLLAGAIIY